MVVSGMYPTEKETTEALGTGVVTHCQSPPLGVPRWRPSGDQVGEATLPPRVAVLRVAGAVVGDGSGALVEEVTGEEAAGDGRGGGGRGRLAVVWARPAPTGERLCGSAAGRLPGARARRRRPGSGRYNSREAETPAAEDGLLLESFHASFSEGRAKLIADFARRSLRKASKLDVRGAISARFLCGRRRGRRG